MKNEEFLIISHPDYGQMLYEELLKPLPEVEGPRRPLFRGEIGVIDDGFVFVKSTPKS